MKRHICACIPGLARRLGMLGLMLAGVAAGQERRKEPWDHVPPPSGSWFLQDWHPLESAAWQMRLAGHVRTMAEAYRNPDFGFAGLQEDAWIHHRIQVFGALEHGQDLTLAAELTWGEMQGKTGPLAPVDEDQADLLQLYFQVRGEIGSSELVMRVGRQVLYYGAGRLLAHREGANQRLSHDALRLSWRQGGWRIDALVASPVQISPQAFDNSSHFDQTQLWGVYATGPSPLGKGHGLDLYYLGLHEEDAALAPGQDELRHTFGTRWFGQTERWRYNHEFILQTGDSAGQDILAGAVSLGLARVFKAAPLHPVVGVKGDAITGGMGGGESHTFNPLFQANNYFNEGGFVSPSNLWNLNPYLSLELHRSLALTLGVNFLWRFDPDDAVYGPPLNALAGAAPQGERYLGTAYNVAVSWDPHPAWNISVGYTHHEAGPSLTSVGGKSVDYLQVAARLEF